MNQPKLNAVGDFKLVPIGYIHSRFTHATGAPIQPSRAADSLGCAVLQEQFVAGLADVAGFDRIWLIYWFHRAAAPKMRVVPYRDTAEHGLFATRAPARPNPIGMSCVRLLDVGGNILRLAGVDILDNTPLLDIKPYVPQYDNYPVERCGWLDQVPDKPVVADNRFERANSAADFTVVD